MLPTVSVSIDVADLTSATDFYMRALSCEMKERHSDAWVVVSVGSPDNDANEREVPKIGAAAKIYRRRITRQA
jgi:hypothetical protein